MIKAVIFDLDGVIADSEPLHRTAANMIFSRVGAKPDFDTTGILFREILSRISERNGLNLDVESLVQSKFKIMLDIAKVEMDPIENSIELVNSLGDVKLAVVSSSTRAWVEFVLKKFGIYDRFDAVITADETKKGKPDAEPYLLASERLKVLPENCLAIEDSCNGITSAKAAGMRCVAFESPNTKNQDLSSADCSIRSLLEIRKMVM
ncbi:MAG: HAD-IA family hydrolase [Candidatus Aenigmatarchaeota archaeon]